MSVASASSTAAISSSSFRSLLAPAFSFFAFSFFAFAFFAFSVVTGASSCTGSSTTSLAGVGVRSGLVAALRELDCLLAGCPLDDRVDG